MKGSCVEAAASPPQRSFPNLRERQDSTSLETGSNKALTAPEEPACSHQEAMPATLPLGLCVLVCPPIRLMPGDIKSICNSRSVTVKRGGTGSLTFA